MVRVIIDVGAMRFANVVGESAMNSAECPNALQAFNAADAREVCQAEGGHGVAQIVNARHRKFDSLEPFIPHFDVGDQPTILCSGIDGGIIQGCRCFTAGCAAVLKSWTIRSNGGLVDHRIRHLFREGVKPCDESFPVTIHIKVVGIHARDDGMGGIQVEKAPVEFVGFNHQPFAGLV